MKFKMSMTMDTVQIKHCSFSWLRNYFEKHSPLFPNLRSLSKDFYLLLSQCFIHISDPQTCLGRKHWYDFDLSDFATLPDL